MSKRPFRKQKLLVGFLIVLSVGSLAGLLTNLPTPAAGMGLNWSVPSPVSASSPTPSSLTVAANVQAFYQGDPTIGWDSPDQYRLWWNSACAPAALTMALRAWGESVTIGQVLDRLIANHAITPENGLLHAEALGQAAQAYGFQALTFWKWNVQQLGQVTAQGVPVLVNLVDARRQTPYPAFDVGHWFVVTGVAADHISIRDSSGYHIHSLSQGMFHTLFTGIGVVIWKGATITLPT